MKTSAKSKTTIKTLKTTQSTTKSTRATTSAAMKHAEYCAPHKKYNNSLNCCCPPPITKTVNVGNRAVNAQSVNETGAVSGAHICQVCKGMGSSTCCPPVRLTITKTITRK